LSRLHRLVKLDLEQHAARGKRGAACRRFAGGRGGRIKKIYGAGVRYFVRAESGAHRRLADPGRQRPLRRQRENAFGKIGRKFLTEIL
jgi:hypothetical protein